LSVDRQRSRTGTVGSDPRRRPRHLCPAEERELKREIQALVAQLAQALLDEREGEARARLDAARSKLPSRHREMTAEESNRHEQPPIRLASVADAPAFGRLLYAFNLEFGESTPDAR
jgi:hypothetical protein